MYQEERSAMAAMLNTTLSLLAVILLSLITEISATYCTKDYYPYSSYYCSGRCCTNSCCSVITYNYSWAYSGFAILPILIVICCLVSRRRRLQQQAYAHNASSITVVNQQSGVGNPGFTPYPNTAPGTYPPPGQTQYGMYGNQYSYGMGPQSQPGMPSQPVPSQYGMPPPGPTQYGMPYPPATMVSPPSYNEVTQQPPAYSPPGNNTETKSPD